MPKRLFKIRSPIVFWTPSCPSCCSHAPPRCSQGGKMVPQGAKMEPPGPQSINSTDRLIHAMNRQIHCSIVVGCWLLVIASKVTPTLHLKINGNKVQCCWLLVFGFWFPCLVSGFKELLCFQRILLHIPKVPCHAS